MDWCCERSQKIQRLNRCRRYGAEVVTRRGRTEINVVRTMKLRRRFSCILAITTLLRMTICVRRGSNEVEGREKRTEKRERRKEPDGHYEGRNQELRRRAVAKEYWKPEMVVRA